MWLIKSDRLSIYNNDNNSNNFIGFVQWWFILYFCKPLQWDYVKTKMQYKHCKEYQEHSIMYYAYVICLNSIDLLKYSSMLCLYLCPRPVCRRFRPVCRQPRPVCWLLRPSLTTWASLPTSHARPVRQQPKEIHRQPRADASRFVPS